MAVSVSGGAVGPHRDRVFGVGVQTGQRLAVARHRGILRRVRDIEVLGIVQHVGEVGTFAVGVELQRSRRGRDVVHGKSLRDGAGHLGDAEVVEGSGRVGAGGVVVTPHEHHGVEATFGYVDFV